MSRRRAKIVVETWDRRVEIDTAIAQGNYSKSWLREDDRKILSEHYGHDTGLYKVTYYDLQPPFDELLTTHFRTYPKAMCEIVSPPTDAGHEQVAMRSWLFVSPTELECLYENICAADSRVLIRRRLSKDGILLEEDHEIYDSDGNFIGTDTYADGRMASSTRMDGLRIDFRGRNDLD